MSHDLSAACRRLVGRASARRRRRDCGNDHEGLGETVPLDAAFLDEGQGVVPLAVFRRPLWASCAMPLPAGHAKMEVMACSA